MYKYIHQSRSLKLCFTNLGMCWKLLLPSFFFLFFASIDKSDSSLRHCSGLRSPIWICLKSACWNLCYLSLSLIYLFRILRSCPVYGSTCEISSAHAKLRLMPRCQQAHDDPTAEPWCNSMCKVQSGEATGHDPSD